MSVSGLVEVGIVSATSLIIAFGSIRYLSLKHKHMWVPPNSDSEENPLKTPALRCSSCGEIKEIPSNNHAHKWKIIEEGTVIDEKSKSVKGICKIQQCMLCGELKEVRFNA